MGWRISEEDFWRDSKLGSIFNDLKIRASYGVVGDDNIDANVYRAYDYMSGYKYNQGGTGIDGEDGIGWKARAPPATTYT